VRHFKIKISDPVESVEYELDFFGSELAAKKFVAMVNEYIVVEDIIEKSTREFDNYQVEYDADFSLLEMKEPEEPKYTDRELQIARLVRDGSSSVAIARKLGISLDRVKNILRKIRSKSDSPDRTSMVVAMMREGYLE
jgi:DNA-binding NarL/FixJ family response regulator